MNWPDLLALMKRGRVLANTPSGPVELHIDPLDTEFVQMVYQRVSQDLEYAEKVL
jgi:hypothetical protein